MRASGSVYLLPASILEHLFLFKEMTGARGALHKVALLAFQVHLKGRGFLYLIVQPFLQFLRTWLRKKGGETCVPRQDGHTYEVPVPPGGPQTLPARSFLIPRVRLSADVEMLGPGLHSAPVARPPIDSRDPRLRSASL